MVDADPLRRRTAIVLAIAGAGVVALVAVALPRAGTWELTPAFPEGERTAQSAPRPVDDTSGIDGVLAWETRDDVDGRLTHHHVDGPVDYAITPPVGGEHNIVWMNAGVYARPVPSERAVHDIEHGAVWITYAPDLPPREIAALVDLVEAQSLIRQTGTGVSGLLNRYLVLSPWADDGLPSPIVISSWGHQLRVDRADDPRLQAFIDVFRHSAEYSPELDGPVDGVPTDVGGRPAELGAVPASPPGRKGAGRRSRGSARLDVNLR